MRLFYVPSFTCYFSKVYEKTLQFQSRVEYFILCTIERVLLPSPSHLHPPKQDRISSLKLLESVQPGLPSESDA